MWAQWFLRYHGHLQIFHTCLSVLALSYQNRQPDWNESKAEYSAFGRGRPPYMIGPERLQQFATTASLSFLLPGCLSKLSCNQNQRLGYSALIKAVHKADFPLYNSDIHLSFAGLISGGVDGQESDEPQGSVSKENHNDHKYNLGRTEKYRCCL